MNQVDESKGGGHQPADKFDEAGTHKIANAFDVAHDARNEHARFVGVVERDGQAADMRLHLAAQLGDHLLRGFGEKLRESERRQPWTIVASQNRPARSA